MPKLDRLKEELHIYKQILTVTIVGRLNRYRLVNREFTAVLVTFRYGWCCCVCRACVNVEIDRTADPTIGGY